MRRIVYCVRRYSDGYTIEERDARRVCACGHQGRGFLWISDHQRYEAVCDDIRVTLYPILRRLEAGALLTVHSVEHNGRLRKYYHITDAGRARIEEFKEEWKELESIYRFIVKEEVRDE